MPLVAEVVMELVGLELEAAMAAVSEEDMVVLEELVEADSHLEV